MAVDNSVATPGASFRNTNQFPLSSAPCVLTFVSLREIFDSKANVFDDSNVSMQQIGLSFAAPCSFPDIDVINKAEQVVVLVSFPPPPK
jgi:hypothetical protein